MNCSCCKDELDVYLTSFAGRQTRTYCANCAFYRKQCCATSEPEAYAEAEANRKKFSIPNPCAT